MGIIPYFGRARPVSQTSTTTSRGPQAYWLLFASSLVLSALSITNVGLISSMVDWLLEQNNEMQTFQVNWPGNITPLNVEPKNLWVNQGHASNGVAAYGFFVGIFGMITAWRMRKAGRRLRSLTALTVLLLLAMLFTFSVFVFVFVVTYQTTGQHIREPVASNTVDINYPEFHWTPETWFKAVADFPLADEVKRQEIKEKTTSMVVWRWMLLPILEVDSIAFGCGVVGLRELCGAMSASYT
ncbi:hypothetical protein BDW02DRAFT_569820 [Decorospora gaudefroyi]|uniref:Uncharacterized protein n=1 Tax=Decorospora gaudefroyi TaxID=184978 RepID=A0A6A5KAN0_9PLEO|nr:hypothetical protein BDW02DRAFT_569820 [Decorospora gaudefroyi]